MKKLSLLFLLAIFAPALLLGVLALRTASRQRMIMQQQEIELRQKETDELAQKVSALLVDDQHSFLDAVERLRARLGTEQLGRDFSTGLHAEWPRQCVGFAVNQDGAVLSPTVRASPDPTVREFLQNNAAFLGNQAAAEVYQPVTKAPVVAQAAAAASISSRSVIGDIARSILPARGDRERAASDADSSASLDTVNDEARLAAKSEAYAAAPEADKALKENAPLAQNRPSQKLRAVYPQNLQSNEPAIPVSQLNAATSRFRQLVADGHDGILARYVEDQLVVIFWVRPAGLGQYILGAQMNAADLFQDIRPGLDPFTSRDACLAILDEHPRPVALSVQGFNAPWNTPFVATEIGEALPHWEAALYLLNPNAISESAHLITLTLYGLVGLAIAAIAWGSILITMDTRRQLNLAQKKTDFVSNVSHELKTPLTSIRMFAELLHEERVTDPAKTANYLGIIRLEAERLTRLINNVLDFARLERNQKHYTRRLMDLRPEIEQLWRAQAEHLRAQGFVAGCQLSPGPWPALVDSDAIVQVIVNLLSNAEKYSTGKKEVEIHGGLEAGEIKISVLDRGTGVPAGQETKIFESFYRAHDSLSSGIPGSGLGLTLAQSIASDHGGDIRCGHRSSGGSIFTLTLPASQEPL